MTNEETYKSGNIGASKVYSGHVAKATGWAHSSWISVQGHKAAWIDGCIVTVLWVPSTLAWHVSHLFHPKRSKSGSLVDRHPSGDRRWEKLLHNLDSGFLRGTPEGQDERSGKEGGWRDSPRPCEVWRRGKGRRNKEWEGQG